MILSILRLCSEFCAFNSILQCFFSALQWCAAINHPAEFGPDFIVFWARLWYPATATKDTGQGGHKPRTSVVLGALARSLVFFTAVRLKGPVGGLPLKTVREMPVFWHEKYSKIA